MANTTPPHPTPLSPPHECPVHGDWPQSPNALAAAVNLATLSDTRPSTAQTGHGHGDDDDDDSGGISLADYQQFVEAMPVPDTPGADSEEEEHEEASIDIQIHDFLSQAHPAYAPYHAFEIIDASSMPHHTSTAYFTPSPVFMTHLSNADPALEPPPSLHEPQLSIGDKTAFCPITSYFHHFFDPSKPLVPGLDLCEVPKFVDRNDLKGDRYDYQGIDWEARKTSRSAVREAREGFESDRLPQCLKEVRKHIPPTANTDDFFQFKRISTTPRAFIPHFQLRNIITATSRNDIFFAQGHKVWRTDAEGTEADAIVDLSKHINPDASITTVASHDNVLIAGAFEGEYAITNLASTYGSPFTFGRTSDFATDAKSQIVNHMHLFASRRTYTPQAVLCSNDHRLRVLDCETNTFTHSFLYPAAVNCSATSPNGRMRVVVGDFQETLITNAETGQAFETLNSHTDDAFACAWADDGIHVATAAQDSTIVVWDARYWDKPLTVMKSELSVPRSLHFSPIGSGPRVLVAAEADDYINVINAQTWESKQVFDFFGPVGGVTFTPDGQSLFVSNGERRFGGIIELERTGWAEKTGRRKSWDHAVWDDVVTDWVHDDALHDHGGVLPGKMERQRRHVDLSDVVV